jgi:peroxiredoxin Q/BCP
MLKVDDPAPDFTLPADDGSKYTLSKHRGKRQLLVFYPGDNTPVCTAQLCDYRDGIEEFAQLNIEVVGISADDSKSHQGFRKKHDLPFTLLSDAGGAVAKQYGSWGLLGMKRSVFLVDEKGVIRYAKVESVALFRRQREELLEAFGSLAKA